MPDPGYRTSSRSAVTRRSGPLNVNSSCATTFASPFTTLATYAAVRRRNSGEMARPRARTGALDTTAGSRTIVNGLVNVLSVTLPRRTIARAT